MLYAEIRVHVNTICVNMHGAARDGLVQSRKQGGGSIDRILHSFAVSLNNGIF